MVPRAKPRVPVAEVRCGVVRRRRRRGKNVVGCIYSRWWVVVCCGYFWWILKRNKCRGSRERVEGKDV